LLKASEDTVSVRRPLRKWIFRLGFLSVLCAIYLGTSTLWALLSFWRTKELYPRLSYPAPDFSPEVTWAEERPPDWVRLSSMPRSAWMAVIAAEDGGFFKHNGVEWEQSVAKIRKDLMQGEFPHGISTLHQQIAKNIYFGARPAFTRKLQEMVIARRMNSQIQKKRVLEIYMNIAEWGPGVVGIGAAARYYFKKPVSQLTRYECALLANLLPNPRTRGEWVKKGRVPSKLLRQVNRTLRRLPYTQRVIRSQMLARSEN